MATGLKRGAALAALALSTFPAEARTVDYSLDFAALQQAASDQSIGSLSPAPERGDVQLAFETAPGADHVTLAVGVACSAYKVENPVSQMLRPLLMSWDADGTLGNPSAPGVATIALLKASSYNRCVQLGEMDGRCITRVKLSGTLSVPTDGGTPRSIPISADVEKSGTVGGFCANLARFIGIVSREAGIALIADAARKRIQP